MRGVLMVLWLAVGLGLGLLAGCGDGDPAGADDADRAGSPTADAPAPASNDEAAPTPSSRSTGDEARDGAGAPPDDALAAAAAADGDGDGATASDPPSLDLESAMRRIDALVEAAEFNQAVALCRELRNKVEGGAARSALSQRLVEVTAMRRRAVGLSFAIERLGASHPFEARRAAQSKLVSARAVGRIYLRKAVRTDESLETAAAAATLLAELDDAKGVALFVERLAEVPDEPLRSALVEAVGATAGLLDLRSTVELAGLRHEAALAEHRPALEAALIAAIQTPFAAEALTELHERVVADGAAAHRPAIDVLARLYAEAAARDASAFNAMFTGGDRLESLRRIVQSLRGADDPATAAWAEGTYELLLRFDFDELRRGLVAWWGFDSVDNGKVADAGGRDHPARIIGDRPGQTEGIIGRAFAFQTDNRGVESVATEDHRFRHIHQRSYAFAAWVKPGALPEDKQPDARGGIVTKEGWHLGLMLLPDGRFYGMHYHGREQGTSVTTDQPRAIGRWHHVVFSVDREAGRLMLFVAGKPAGTATLPPDAGYWDRHDSKPVRVGLARFGPGDFAWRFNGAIDEVAIYRRALAEDDALALSRIDTASLRDRLKPDPPQP